MENVKTKRAVDPLWAWLMILFLPLNLGVLILLGVRFGHETAALGAIAFTLFYAALLFLAGKRAERRARNAGTP